MKISIVVPMWNEESWVEQAYKEISNAVQKLNLDAQIVFATDGCTDSTVEIIKKLQKELGQLIVNNQVFQNLSKDQYMALKMFLFSL